MKPKQIPLSVRVPPELAEAITAALASGTLSRNAQIVEWLWKVPAIRRTADELGIARTQVNPAGRPSK